MILLQMIIDLPEPLAIDQLSFRRYLSSKKVYSSRSIEMKLRESNKLFYRICINTVGFRKMLINNNRKLNDMEDNLNFNKWEIVV